MTARVWRLYSYLCVLSVFWAMGCASISDAQRAADQEDAVLEAYDEAAEDSE